MKSRSPPSPPPPPPLPDAVIHAAATELLARKLEDPPRAGDLVRRYRLLEIQRATKPAAPASRWRRGQLWTPAWLVTAALAIGVMHTCHTSSTEIELDVTSTDLAYTVSGTSTLIARPATLAALTVLHLARVEMSPTSTIHQAVAHGEPPRVMFAAALPAADDAARDRASSTSSTSSDRAPGQPSSQIALDGISAAGGTSVELGFSDGAKLDLKLGAESSVVLRVTVRGELRLGASEIAVASPETIDLVSRPDEQLHARLSFAGAPPSSWLRPVSIHRLAFRGQDDLSTTGSTRIVARSGITEGTVFLAGVARTEVLRIGEYLDLGCANGVLRQIQAGRDSLRVRFHGSACSVEVGHGSYRRDLMPTWLDWVRAREPLKVFWVSLLWLFGLLSGIAVWWRQR